MLSRLAMTRCGYPAPCGRTRSPSPREPFFFSAEIPWEIDERASIETFYSPPGKPRIIEKTASFQENAHHARSPAHAIVEKADGLR
jgi:hypothetical protein